MTGAKNAAVAILPATILARGICVIENLPNIADVLIIKRILAEIGAEVEFENGTMTVDTTNINTSKVTMNLVKKMRASYYLLGALLSRFNDAEINLPGGCTIGERPIDLHIKACRRWVRTSKRSMGGLSRMRRTAFAGCDIYMDKVSVGATINVMLASVCAEGQTSIINAAKEPHVVDVANFLVCMGAKIKGAGTDVIRITGVENCTDAIIRLSPTKSKREPS